MADYYWVSPVSGTGFWSDAANWRTTSGGGVAYGTPPTASDNVIFDNNSHTGIYTVTINSSVTCANFSCVVSDTLKKMTLGGNGSLTVYGSWYNAISSYYARTYIGSFTFASTSSGNTIEANGVIFSSGQVFFDGVGGSWSMSSAITCGPLNLINGSFNTNNFNVTAGGLLVSNTNACTLVLSTSATPNTPVVSLTNTAYGLNFCPTTTIPPTTNSTITIGNASISVQGNFQGAGLTFGNVTLSPAASAGVYHQNTFANLTIGDRTNPGFTTYTFFANQTVMGAFTVNAGSTSINRRIFLTSNDPATNRSISAGSISIVNTDFRRITAVGSTWDGSAQSWGDCGGNSANILFRAGRSVYWNLAGTNNWSATGWALTNNGTPAAANFPLAQDTATFTEAGAAGTINVDAAYLVGSVDMADGVSNRSTALTLGGSSALSLCGSTLRFFPALSSTNTGGYTFFILNGAATFTSAGIATMATPVTINAPGSTVTLADALTTTNVSSIAFTLTNGTLNLNNFNLTLSGRFTITNTVATAPSVNNACAITFGTGEIRLAATTTQTIFSAANITYFSYTGTGLFRVTGAAAVGVTRTISFPAAGGTESNSPHWSIEGGAGTIFCGNIAFIGNLTLTSGFTGTFNWAFSKVIFGNVVINSGATIAGGAQGTTFRSSTEKTLTTNGVSIDAPISIGSVDGPGNLRLADNLTLGATNGSPSLSAGSLNLDGKTLSCKSFSISGSSSKTLAFGVAGILSVYGSGSTAFTATGSNTTTTGTGKIEMTSASAKTFAGGDFSYPALDQAGAGALTVTGSNTFGDISSSYTATGNTSIIFASSATQTVSSFTATGTAADKVLTIGATDGPQATLSKSSGKVQVTYTTISKSNATGGATWDAYTLPGNVDGGDNSGWFGAGGIPSGLTLAGGFSISTKAYSISNGLSFKGFS